MAGPNDQQLPPGLGAAAPVAPAIPGAPVGSSVITLPNPTPAAPAAAPAPAQPLSYDEYMKQFAAQPAPAAAPAPVAPPVNPMLTTLQPPAPPTAAPAPAPQPAPPVVPEPPKPEAPKPGTVSDLAGALGADPQLAPGIAYLEATATAANLDVQRAFGNAADELDARFIDRAYLVEKVGQAQADQMVKVAEASIAYANQARENLYTECRAVAGGDAGWQQAVALFNQHADANTKAVIAGQFDTMNKTQMLDAAARIVAFAKQTGGFVQNGGQPLGAPGAATGLTSEQYRAELAKLPRNAPDSAYEALRAQRSAGLKAGLQ